MVRHTALVDQSSLISLINSSISWAQLERGSLDVGYRVVEASPITLSSRTVNLAVQVQASLAPHKTAVAIVDSDRPGARWIGRRVDGESIGVSREELDLRTTGASTARAIVVDEKALQTHAGESPDVEDVLRGLNRNGVSRNPVGAARLRAAVHAICFRRTVPSQRSIAGTIVPLLAASLVDFDTNSVECNGSLTRRFSAVRTCERYMRDHLDGSVTILDLSRATGMRSRTLINAFEAITGFSPMDYLKRLRLSAVHRALKCADRSHTRIVDVAMDWGFWHMGHFARDYRAMFGESPSQTLLE